MGLLDSVKSSVSAAMTQVKAAVVEAPPPPPPPPAPTGHGSASSFGEGATVPPLLTGGAGLAQLQSAAPTFRPSELRAGSSQELVRTTVVDKSNAAPGTPAFQSQVTDIELGIVDMYLKTGQYQNARALLDVMEKNPHLDAKRQAFQQKDCLDVNGRVSESRSKEDGGVQPVLTTDRQLIADKRAQLKVAEEMSKTVGKPIDPSNLEQAKQYFDTLSAQKPKLDAKVISEKFGDYARAFYRFDNHDWPPIKPGEQRDDAATVSAMFDTQPHDSAGRSVLDCEGLTYLTASMFKNNPRFDVTYAADAHHISACVFEKGTTKGFSVNTLNRTEGKTIPIDEKKTSKPIAEQQAELAGVRHGHGRGTYRGPSLEKADAD